MEIIAPHPETFILPKGTQETVYAAKQTTTYQQLPSLKTPDGRVISQWRPSTEEIDRLINGEPLTLIVHTFGQKLQPVILGVGGFDLT